MKRRRVGIVGLLQESNTFIAGVTTRAHFEADLLLHGEAIREAMAGAPHEVGGFFAGLDEAGLEAVPLFLARALPYGVIKQEDFEGLVAELLEAIASAGPLDGVSCRSSRSHRRGGLSRCRRGMAHPSPRRDR